MKKLLLAITIIFSLLVSEVFADTAQQKPIGLDNHEIWWSFDGSTYDPIGGGVEDQEGSHDLSILEVDSSQIAQGYSGNGFRSRGSSPTYAGETTTNFNSYVAGDFSIAFAVRVDAFSTQDMVVLFSHQGATTGWSIYIDGTNHDLNFSSTPDCTSAPITTVGGNTALNLGQWYHVTLTRNNASGSTIIYIDNVADASSSIVAVCLPAVPLLVLGGAAGLDLSLDEVHIFDDLLSSSERNGLVAINADDETNRDFRIFVDVTDTSGSSRTDFQAIPIIDAAAHVTGGYLQSDSDDLLFYSSGIIDGTALSDGSATSSWMTRIAAVPASGTSRYFYYMGEPSSNLTRYQTFFSNSSSDTITITDDATLDITTDLGISVQVEVHANPSATTYLVDKWTANTGYRFGINSSGDIVAQVDATTLTVTPNYTFSVLSMVYDGTDLEIYENTERLGSVAAGSLTANAEDVVLFNTSDAAITSQFVEIRSDQGQPGENDELLLTFRTDHIVETDAGDAGDGWTWEGTIADQSGSGNNGTYLITSDHSDTTLTAGPLTAISSSLANAVGQADFNSLWFPDLNEDFITAGATDSNFPMQVLISSVASDVGISDDSLWFGIFLAIGLGVGAVMARQWLALGLLSATVLVLAGASANLFTLWPAVLVSIFAFGTYGLDSLNRSGGL